MKRPTELSRKQEDWKTLSTKANKTSSSVAASVVQTHKRKRVWVLSIKVGIFQHPPTADTQHLQHPDAFSFLTKYSEPGEKGSLSCHFTHDETEAYSMKY